MYSTKINYQTFIRFINNFFVDFEINGNSTILRLNENFYRKRMFWNSSTFILSRIWAFNG